jgi:uncharacterized protein
MIAESPVTLTTVDGTILEARVSTHSRITAGVVVCHPHPLYGGDMESPVVLRAVEEASRLGLATLRFNFRGVGRSGGVHGHGVAEQQDVEAALEHLRRPGPSRQSTGGRSIVSRALGVPPERIVLAGYSFGALVAAQVCVSRRVGGLALIAPPLAGSGDRGGALPVDGGTRVLVIAGTRDPYCPASELARARAAMPSAEIVEIEGADHFFEARIEPLGEAFASWLTRTMAGSDPGQ